MAAASTAPLQNPRDRRRGALIPLPRPELGNADYRLFKAMAAGHFGVDAGMQQVQQRGGWPVRSKQGFVVAHPADYCGEMHIVVEDGRRLRMEHAHGMYFVDVPSDLSSTVRYRLEHAGHRFQDPWSRQYSYDPQGQPVSLVGSEHSHIERFLDVSGEGLKGRAVRIWIPEHAPKHVLYWNDGQHVFDPVWRNGLWVQDMLPTDVSVVAIDNTAERLLEYAPHTKKHGRELGGKLKEYGNLVAHRVVPLAERELGTHYDHWERPTRWRVGTSLGGLEALQSFCDHPHLFQKCVSMSGTFKWGSQHLDMQGPSFAESFEGCDPSEGREVYLDSGGGKCWPEPADDNYRSTIQVGRKLLSRGWQLGQNLVYHHEEFHPRMSGTNGHGERFWRERLWRPFKWLGAY